MIVVYSESFSSRDSTFLSMFQRSCCSGVTLNIKADCSWRFDVFLHCKSVKKMSAKSNQFWSWWNSFISWWCLIAAKTYLIQINLKQDSLTAAITDSLTWDLSSVYVCRFLLISNKVSRSSKSVSNQMQVRKDLRSCETEFTWQCWTAYIKDNFTWQRSKLHETEQAVIR